MNKNNKGNNILKNQATSSSISTAMSSTGIVHT
jgi:hypothetical protein